MAFTSLATEREHREMDLMEAILMRPVGLISTVALLLLFGAFIPAYAQQEQHGQDANTSKQEQQAKPKKQQQQQKAKGQQQQRKQQQAKGQQTQQPKQQQPQKVQQPRVQQQQQPQKVQQPQQAQGQRQQQQQRAQQQVNQPSQQPQRVQQAQQPQVWQQHRARNWQSEHRDWQQRGGYSGYRIPDNRYRSNFGPGHWFRIYRYPMELYGGYPRFQYDGFWFALMDPWPEYWSDDWYDNDDVYIVYSDGGYYLYNRRYPRDRIAIEVYLN